MTYLLDTDRVIDYLAGRPEAKRLISALIDDGIAISLVTYGEIYDGIYGSQDPQTGEAGFTALLTGVTVMPFNRPNHATFRSHPREPSSCWTTSR